MQYFAVGRVALRASKANLVVALGGGFATATEAQAPRRNYVSLVVFA